MNAPLRLFFAITESSLYQVTCAYGSQAEVTKIALREGLHGSVAVEHNLTPSSFLVITTRGLQFFESASETVFIEHVPAILKKGG